MILLPTEMLFQVSFVLSSSMTRYQEVQKHNQRTPELCNKEKKTLEKKKFIYWNKWHKHSQSIPFRFQDSNTPRKEKETLLIIFGGKSRKKEREKTHPFRSYFWGLCDPNEEGTGCPMQCMSCSEPKN